MEDVIQGLVKDAIASVALFRQNFAANGQRKYIIAVAGSPGSGKTTIANELCNRLNKLHADGYKEAPLTAFLPMDGYHLYKRELDDMPDPKEAYKRRGAPWTFNPKALLALVQQIQREGHAKAPSFDHKVGDPIEEDIIISAAHELVILEGNYVFLDEAVWREIGDLCDERWFVDLPLDEAMERVVRRHIGTGLTPEAARHRVETNDRPNGQEIIDKSKQRATKIIHSCHDESLRKD